MNDWSNDPPGPVTNAPDPFPLLSPSAATEELDATSIHLWWVPRQRGDGRAPLLSILAGYLQTTPARVVLRTDTHGRPRLAAAHGDNLAFNWSHSGGRAVVAVARHLPRLGVDLEYVKPGRDGLAIARRYFAPQEQSLLATLPATARSRAFVRLWTAKEALLKAHGAGLAFGLDRAVFDLAPDDPRIRQLDPVLGAPEHWQLAHWPLAGDGFATLCWQGATRSIRHVVPRTGTAD